MTPPLDPRIQAFLRTRGPLAPVGVRCALVPLDRGRFYVQPHDRPSDTSSVVQDGEYIGYVPFEVNRNPQGRDVVTVPLSDTTAQEVVITPPLRELWISLCATVETIFDLGEPSESTTGVYTAHGLGGTPFSAPSVSDIVATTYASDPPAGSPFIGDLGAAGSTETTSIYTQRYNITALSLYVADVDYSGGGGGVWTPLPLGEYEVHWDTYRYALTPSAGVFDSSHSIGPFQMTGAEDKDDPSTWPTVSTSLSWDLISNGTDIEGYDFRDVTFHLI